MTTPHLKAEMGQIADTVLMPGDPLRAKFIADNFLEDAVQYNSVRAEYGFTGTYKGKKISVQSSGMGLSSASIYATELFKFYGVNNIIRVGTAGAISTDVHVRDLVLAEGSCTNTRFVHNFFDPEIEFSPIADFNLLRTAADLADEKGFTYHVGNTIGVDRFYNDRIDNDRLAQFGILATEMELPAIYSIAAEYHKHALGILTISDHIVTGESTTSDERQTGFKQMMELALDTAVKFAGE